MKKLTLQGEQHKFEYLYKNIGINDKDENKIPYEVETRVYVLEISDSEISETSLSDDEFQTLAEEQGRVYTLQGFQEAFNLEEINSAIDVIRFISVPIS